MQPIRGRTAALEMLTGKSSFFKPKFQNNKWGFRLLYSPSDRRYSTPVQLKLLNAAVLDECVASVAFYVRDSLDYKLTKLTEVGRPIVFLLLSFED